jgi:hypothetical protein
MSLRRPSAFALAFGAAALAAVAPAHAAPRPPVASLLEGALCEGPEGSPCEAKAPFAPHRELRAGPKGAALRLGNGATLRFDAGASFALGPAVPLPTAGQAVPLRAPVVVLHAGRVQVRAAAGGAEPSAVVFRGPRTTSALFRTGEAALRASDEGLAIGVSAGAGAKLAAGNTWGECAEGSTCSAPGKHAGVSRRPALEAPAPLAHALAAATLDGRPLAATLRWRPSQGAARYEIRLARSADFAEAARSFETPATEAPLADLSEVGTHWAALRALDAEGLPGPWSSTVRVRVVGVETPKGALVTPGGAIALPPGAQLTLRGAEGLRVGTEGIQDEFDAPAQIGVGRGAARPLRLREPGGDEGVPLRLEPRTMRLAVEMGPKTARWPEDAVAIRVRLADGEGRPLPDDFALNVDVTFDLQPVQLRWQREGNFLVAAVPARPITAPGVLRAEVSDPHGLALGRGSLEILPSARVVALPAR